MLASENKNPKDKETPLSAAFDSFNETVSDLGSSYKELTHRIQELNVEMSEKNKFLEKNFFEVNRLKGFFDSILNSMNDGVVVIDNDGKIVLFNRGIQHLTGYKSEDVLGKSYRDVFGKHVSDRFSPIFTLRKGTPLEMEEKEIRIDSGQLIPVRYSTSLVRDNQDRVVGVVEVINDLTRIRRLEREMQHYRTQAALNQMAGLVAHEIRNPLGGIRGYVDLLSEYFEGDDQQTEMVDHIRISIRRLDKIVANFLHFARPVKPNLVETELKAYLQEVLGYFQQSEDLESKGIHLELFLPDVPVLVKIDPMLMEQVFLVVLDNGAKAMPNGGRLVTEVMVHQKGASELSQNLRVVISDSGEGMSQDVQARLFTPFFTTRDKGMGLGLALARNFIALHHGDIRVESQPGIGTRVTVELPLETRQDAR